MTSTQWRRDVRGLDRTDDDVDDAYDTDDGSDDHHDDHGRPVRPGRRRRRIALAVVIAVVLATFATWLVAFSPVFGVRGVEVHGEKTLTSTTVERVAAIDYGQPLVRVDTAAVTERLEAVPQIASAEVSTSFPSTVVITVRERTPVGYVTVAGRPLLVDATGVRYPAAGKEETVPTGVPHLVLPGGTSAAATATAQAVATVAGGLPASLRAKVATVQALDPRSVTVLFRGGILVRWGSAERNAQKATVVALLKHRHPIPQTIDVSDPDRPVTR